MMKFYHIFLIAFILFLFRSKKNKPVLFAAGAMVCFAIIFIMITYWLFPILQKAPMGVYIVAMVALVFTFFYLTMCTVFYILKHGILKKLNPFLLELNVEILQSSFLMCSPYLKIKYKNREILIFSGGSKNPYGDTPYESQWRVKLKKVIAPKFKIIKLPSYISDAEHYRIDANYLIHMLILEDVPKSKEMVQELLDDLINIAQLLETRGLH